MGDSIVKLPVDDKLKISTLDKTHLHKFFNIDFDSISQSHKNSKESFYSLLKFTVLITLLYYICSHPASIGRFIQNPTYKLFLQTAIFGLILFLYVYFFN